MPTRKLATNERGQGAGLNYLARKPDAADAGRQPWPLLVFLHGAGERGHLDGRDLGKVCVHGPWRCPGAEKFFILAPQCPSGVVWPALAEQVNSLTRAIVDDYGLDACRCYITGISLGAFGAWAAASADPELFAAIVPICGGFSPPLSKEIGLTAVLRRATHPPEKKEIKPMRETPAWLFHGAEDKIVDPRGSQLVFDALGGKDRTRKFLRHTVYKKIGHNVWSHAYRHDELLAWVLKHKRAVASSKMGKSSAKAVLATSSATTPPTIATVPTIATAPTSSTSNVSSDQALPAHIAALLERRVSPPRNISNLAGADDEVSTEDEEDASAEEQGGNFDSDDSDAPLTVMFKPQQQASSPNAALDGLKRAARRRKAILRQAHPAAGLMASSQASNGVEKAAESLSSDTDSDDQEFLTDFAQKREQKKRKVETSSSSSDS
eukprot:TRINITY_DN24177_c0_g1_i1.p1 TRINITY_DN24177_c0_g1~~TRINITY_DN24177_c0_g1_i1.p1  ORF type:complete len:437 (+),score=78.94 TRINITY_DN24177_c0_g1_i1:115-1425(+)